jgi:hypothetical protein
MSGFRQFKIVIVRDDGSLSEPIEYVHYTAHPSEGEVVQIDGTWYEFVLGAHERAGTGSTSPTALSATLFCKRLDVLPDILKRYRPTPPAAPTPPDEDRPTIVDKESPTLVGKRREAPNDKKVRSIARFDMAPHLAETRQHDIDPAISLRPTGEYDAPFVSDCVPVEVPSVSDRSRTECAKSKRIFVLDRNSDTTKPTLRIVASELPPAIDQSPPEPRSVALVVRSAPPAVVMRRPRRFRRATMVAASLLPIFAFAVFASKRRYSNHVDPIVSTPQATARVPEQPSVAHEQLSHRPPSNLETPSPTVQSGDLSRLASQPATRKTPAQGRVTITTEPPGATVLVDGHIIGRTPFDLYGKPDERLRIQIALDGYTARGEDVMPTSEGGEAVFKLRPLSSQTIGTPHKRSAPTRSSVPRFGEQ